MKYALKTTDDKLTFHLEDQVVFSDNHRFKEILSLARNSNAHTIELDFSNVDFIDSAGLGMLLLLRDICQNNHISIAINGVFGQVKKVLMISKFDHIFAINK